MTDDLWQDGGCSILEAARFLGISTRSVYNLVAEERLARSKIRGRAVVARRQLRDLLAAGQARKS